MLAVRLLTIINWVNTTLKFSTPILRNFKHLFDNETSLPSPSQTIDCNKWNMSKHYFTVIFISFEKKLILLTENQTLRINEMHFWIFKITTQSLW